MADHDVAQAPSAKDTAATHATHAKPATGVSQVKAMLSHAGGADPSAVAKVIEAHPSERDQILSLLQGSAGNAFTQQVVASAQADAVSSPHAETQEQASLTKKRDAAGLTAVDEQLGVDKTDDSKKASTTGATSSHASAHSTGSAHGSSAKKSDPLMMPPEIVAYEKKYDIGDQHLEWHTERQWDSFIKDPANAAFAKKHGWKRAAAQEGEKGNGLEFLAMHRSMIQMLKETFPKDSPLFDGWDTPPLVGDAQNPGPSTPMTAAALKAIDTLMHLDQHIDAFADDDEFGIWIETSLGPAHSPDLGMAGIHNYMHNRLANDKSPITMGDPTVNIENKMFWRLHGWIDKRWDVFRSLKKETDKQPEYEQAMKDAAAGMHMGPMPMAGMEMSASGGATHSEPAPAHVREFMMKGGSWGDAK